MGTRHASRAAALALLAISAFMQPVASARAQEVSTAALQEFARWAEGRRGQLAKLARIFETRPQFREQASPAQVGEDVRAMRAWINVSRRTVNEVRAEDLPGFSTAIPEELRALRELNERRFPQVVDAVERFITESSGTVDAVERGDPDGAQRAAISSLDALVLTYTLQRDINSEQAEAIGANNPQAYFLRSMASSYDAMRAYIGLQRSTAAGQTGGREAAAQAIAAAASDMRRHSESGRRAAATLAARLRAQRPSTQDARLFAERATAAVHTFDASFTREERVAQLLGSVAGLLRDDRPHEAVEREIETLILQFDQFDAERLADGQRRTAIIQGQ